MWWLAEFAAAQLSEEDWQKEVCRYLNEQGWWWVHIPNARGAMTRGITGKKGFPDLFAIHPRRKRLVFIELKKEGGYPTAEQRIWHSLLALCGAEVYVWRPSDWRTVRTTMMIPPAERKPEGEQSSGTVQGA